MKRGQFLRRMMAAGAGGALAGIPAAVSAEEPALPPDWLSVQRVPDEGGSAFGRSRYPGEAGSYYFYWKSESVRRGIYNVPPGMAGEVMARISKNPAATYESLGAGVPQVFWADEAAALEGPGAHRFNQRTRHL